MTGHDDVQHECKSFSSGHTRRLKSRTDIGGLSLGSLSGLVDGDKVDLTGKGRTYRIQEIDKETRWDSSVQYDNARIGFYCKRMSY
jgi:endonuclease YncB( thermonuclease family)